MSFIIILPTPAFEAQSDTGLPNFAFCNLPSTFHLQFFGGIAQLVERQLCKLEVRGSNPLASKACKAWRQHLQTGNTFGSLLRALSQIGFWACVRQKTSLSSVPPHHAGR